MLKTKIVQASFLFGMLAICFLHTSCTGIFFGSKYKTKMVTGKEGPLEYSLLTFLGTDAPFKKSPLVLLLHGAQEGPHEILDRWVDEASKRRVMLLAVAWSDLPRSNESGQEGQNFFLNLLNTLETRYPVDPEKLFIAGMSAGGARAQKLLEETPGKWRGCIFMSFVPSLKWFQNSGKETLPALLFTYGLKDPNDRHAALIQGEALLKSQEIPVHLLVDTDAGHEHRPEWNKLIFDWIDLQGKK